MSQRENCNLDVSVCVCQNRISNKKRHSSRYLKQNTNGIYDLLQSSLPAIILEKIKGKRKTAGESSLTAIRLMSMFTPCSSYNCSLNLSVHSEVTGYNSPRFIFEYRFSAFSGSTMSYQSTASQEKELIGRALKNKLETPCL